MKIYYQRDKDDSPELNELLKEAKLEFDEAWLKEAEKQMPAGMELRLQDTIDRLASEEPSARKSPRLNLHLWGRIAACVAIVLALGTAYNMMQRSDSPFIDTCRTPEEAQLQMERALTLINYHSSKGLQMAENNCRPLQEKRNGHLSKYISFE